MNSGLPTGASSFSHLQKEHQGTGVHSVLLTQQACLSLQLSQSYSIIISAMDINSKS